eukprot:gene13707-13829_t
MFKVEEAHWYYEDHVRAQDSSLRSLSLKEFAIMVFQNCPELHAQVDNIEQIMEHFKVFKKNVPVMGGILLDKAMQRVLLVKGWKNSACWGFPRGKIHKNETDMQCAVREVLEETGCDIEELVREEDFIELTLDGKRNKLYIVAGLDPDSAQFAPKCRGEIGGYAWHRVADLPANRDEGSQTFLSEDGVKHKFFMVWPYVRPLRSWIRKRQYNNPEWDMPVPASTPEQQQKHGIANSMHKPYYPQQMQHLLLGSCQPGQGSPATGASPSADVRLDHASFTTPTQAVRQQQPYSNNGKSGSAAGQLQVARSAQVIDSLPGCPLAALFSAPPAATPGATGAEPKGANGKPDRFRFDRQAILHVL